jgi:hypothetical protein
MVIFNYFSIIYWLFQIIFCSFNLFHLKLFSAIVKKFGHFLLFFAIVTYFNLGYL